MRLVGFDRASESDAVGRVSSGAMAPGRRRGAKGGKTKSALSLGDLVLAKVKGFPAWPAKISRPEDWKRAPDPKKYFVQFFGTEEIAFVAPADIQAFTSETKTKLLVRCQGKTVKYFAEAVKEICGAFEVLEQKDSSGLGDDTDRSAHGSEDPSVDGVEGGAVEVYLKDGIQKDGTNGETEIRGGRGSGLERCSWKKHKTSNESARTSKGLVLASSPPNGSVPKEEICNVKQEDSVIFPEDSKGGTPAVGLETNHNDGVCDAKGDGQKNKCSLLVGSVRAKHSVGGNNLLTNGLQLEKMMSGLKRNPKDERAKNIIQRKSAVGSSAKESSPDLKSDGNAVSRNKTKKMAKDGKDFGLANDGKKDAEGSLEEQAKDKLGPAKRDSVINEVSHPAKRSKHADIENNGSKGSFHTTRKIDSRSPNVPARKTENMELKPSTSHLKTENRTSSLVHTGSVPSNISSDEEALPPTKRRRRAFEATSDSAIITSDDRTDKFSGAVKDDVLYYDKIKSPVTQLHTKRRAVRLVDEDNEEEARTPIHGGSLSKIHSSSGVSDCVTNADVKNEVSALGRPSGRDSSEVEVGHSKECFPSSKLLNESSSPHAEQHGEKRPKKALAANISQCPGKPELERVSSKESKKPLTSPKKSPWSGATNKTLSETPNISRQSKVSGAGTQKKTQSGSGKALSIVSDSLIHYHNQGTTQRSMSLSSGERSKSTMENSYFLGERMEAVGDDKTSSLIDLKISDSATSIKHLIAAAQAKRRQAHSQNISHGNAGSLSAPSTETSGRSPSPVASFQPFISGSSNLLQPDVQGYYPRTSMASPHGHLVSSNNQPDDEEFEERRVSSGHRPAGGSLSGGTEAAVARDAFEGMIETLSRTKESIGRATRLAIDCAKYGIANEVVELLIRKLESEASFHRKVDLFFLVDSITQCSHSHKGIAGASYIPIVQAALPRLLGAAAPPGAAASENRRQCIKVLRLWLERKILPESLLRRYMDDIGVPNDDASAGFFLRRPSRAERAVDDPIREMEGMLVDEYGSNATFQLPGFLSSHAFEEDDEDDLPSCSYKEAAGGSPVESVPATGEGEACAVTPNDRRHFVLEDVDGELEMEDVSGHPKDERPSFANGSFERASEWQGSDGILETDLNYSNELDPVHEGSPPLPFDSPPPTPPLPPSPPPPPSPSPPPPPSSSPPPPPPPPLPSLLNDSNPVPLPSSVPHPSLLPQPSLSPQPLVVSQHIHVSQSSTPSSPKLTYQPPLPHEYSSTPSGNKLVQMTVNTPHGVHIDATIRNEMYAHQSSCFVPAGVGNNPHEPSGFTSSRPLDYGHHDSYLNSQPSQPIQPFQTGNAPLGQRPFHHAPPPQTPSSHYLYPTSTVQQNPYPRPYSLPNLPDGPRRYVADEHWRISTGEFNTDKQRGVWMSGGRASSSGLGLPFAHEGYFRPPLERLPVKNVGFQPAAPSSLPAGVPVPVPGHTVSQLLPSRPDMTALNGWRPS